MKSIIKRVLELIKKNPDGFTYNIKTDKLVRFGIVVAYIETQDSFDLEGLKKSIDHALNNDSIVGGWINEDDEMQFDSVKVFRNRDEALKFAVKNKQRFIYDLTNLREIKVEG